MDNGSNLGAVFRPCLDNGSNLGADFRPVRIFAGTAATSVRCSVESKRGLGVTGWRRCRALRLGNNIGAMPVDVFTYTHSPTTVSLGNFNGSTFASTPGAVPTHRLYDAANCRVSLHATLNTGAGVNGITSLDPAPDPAGDTYFLPFATDQIRSIRLPAPAGAACASFLTTNLSGCKMFVDRVTGGNGSIIVYHANNQTNAPPGQVGGQFPAFELTACTNTLRNLYTTARADWAAAPHNLVLQAAGDVGKPVYNLNSDLEVQRKTGQNRSNVEFTGGTIVFGEIAAGAWTLYWATYGACEYDRPWNASKGWFGNKHNNPTAKANPGYRVLGWGQFF